MLKIIFLLSTLFFSLSALACLRVEGQLGVDGETHKINQKTELNKEYSLPLGNFIFSFTLKPAEAKKTYEMKFKLEERRANKLITITRGEEEFEENKAHEVYAKGLEGQPNSIINLKFIPI